MKIEGFTHVFKSRTTGQLGRNQLPETALDTRTSVGDWNGRLAWTPSPRTFIEVRNSGLDYRFNSLSPERRLGPPAHTDRITQILSGNAQGFTDISAGHVLTSAAVRHVLDDVALGSHELEIGFEHDRTNSHTVSGFPGGRQYNDAGGAPEEVILWSGNTIESTGARTSVYVQDVWRAARRLSINPGVRLAFNRGAVPDKGTVFKTNPVSPRVGLAWDVVPDHKTVVRASYGRFHEGLYPNVFDFLSTSGLNSQIRARVLGPETFQEFFRTPIDTVALDDHVAHAFVEQYLTGIEREVLPGVSLKAQYIRRNFKEIWAFIDTGSRYVPVQRQDPGPDARPGTSDDGPLVTVFNLLNLNQSVPVLTNPDGAFRRYDAVQVIGETRVSRNWQLLGAYTWSRTRGTVNTGNGENRAQGADTGRGGVGGVFFNPNRSINNEGRSSGDSPHQVNLQGTYLLPAWGGVRVSGGYRYFTGLPWGRTVAITGLMQGTLQGVRLEPRGTRRLDATSVLDVRLEKTFPLGGSRRAAGIYADLFNVTNRGVAAGVQEASGNAFGQPTGWIQPRTMRVAARVTF